VGRLAGESRFTAEGKDHEQFVCRFELHVRWDIAERGSALSRYWDRERKRNLRVNLFSLHHGRSRCGSNASCADGGDVRFLGLHLLFPASAVAECL